MGRPRDDEADRDVARELRHRVGSEFRAEAEEAERAAAQAARRSRSIADVARLHLGRGDVVVVTVPGRRLTGTVLHAAGDLLALETPAGRVDVRTSAPLALEVTQPGRGAGRDPSPGPSSFRARLLELEIESDQVDVGVSELGDVRTGVLLAVAEDHLVLQTGAGEVLISLPAILWISPRGR